MIRQAISCDICGTEMLNANHWFVAYDRGAELRIGPWSAHGRIKASARHLCGHKCLHKLVDDFMAKTFGVQASSSVAPAAKAALAIPCPDTSLTRMGSHRMQALPIIGTHLEEFESSAQLIKATEVTVSRAASGSTALRAEAWKRERQRQAEQSGAPRRSIA
ncbi:hypothetical protein P8935_10270 [Telmatobacter sp. DSM 110680]|uniref:Uncharacterized protein n=1 Tax=Telmatobacter sp. DSM 110680 TaxID=3036704 RepID=A0AAU7DSH4_9BACT